MRRFVPSLLVLALVLAACGGSGEMTVTDAWGRSSPAVAEAAAFYVTFENGTSVDDRLLGVADTERCDAIEVHKSEMVEGLMQMRPADPSELQVAAGDSLVMEPGGLHVMCIGLRTPLVEGEEVPLTFEFEQAGTVEATVVVEDRT
jgi:copper(I)-binding protein